MDTKSFEAHASEQETDSISIEGDVVVIRLSRARAEQLREEIAVLRQALSQRRTPATASETFDPNKTEAPWFKPDSGAESEPTPETFLESLQPRKPDSASMGKFVAPPTAAQLAWQETAMDAATPSGGGSEQPESDTGKLARETARKLIGIIYRKDNNWLRTAQGATAIITTDFTAIIQDALDQAVKASKTGTCHLCGLPFTELVEHYKCAHPKQAKAGGEVATATLLPWTVEEHKQNRTVYYVLTCGLCIIAEGRNKTTLQTIADAHNQTIK